MEEFFEIRFMYYQKRKDYLMSKLERELEILSTKERFITEVVEEIIVLRNVKKIKIVELLKEKGYKRFSDFPQIKSTKAQSPKKDDGEEENKE